MIYNRHKCIGGVCMDPIKVGKFIANLRKEQGLTQEELAEKASKTVRTVQRTLNSLRDKGYIEREGAKQNTVWKVKK